MKNSKNGTNLQYKPTWLCTHSKDGLNQNSSNKGNLPSGFTIQKHMFGSVTVIDVQLTKGQELGSAVVGRAQGFYLASSMDGSSQSIVLTVFLHGADNDEHHDHERSQGEK
ncbi:hypothetical protein Lal_00049542 [Lupinus albus]|nr:hypothetical protein Lal_00049542 [Lupinus albus]